MFADVQNDYLFYTPIPILNADKLTDFQILKIHYMSEYNTSDATFGLAQYTAKKSKTGVSLYSTNGDVLYWHKSVKGLPGFYSITIKYKY